MLDKIYETLNIAHPRDYYSRSLSMGDIVMLRDGEAREWYMVARFGFEKLEEDEIN